MPIQAQSMLFIGNSYTGGNTLAWMLEQLAAARGETLFTHSICPGGMTLEFHCTNPQAITAIRQRQWTILSLQEQSLRPIEEPDKTIEFGSQLASFVESNHPDGLRKLVYLTWPRKTSPEKGEALRATYRQLAAKIGAEVVPCGPAWLETIRRLPQIELYQPDNSHPTEVATYLNACVFFATLYVQSPVGLPADLWFRTGNVGNHEHKDARQKLQLDPAVAAELQAIAWECSAAERQAQAAR